MTTEQKQRLEAPYRARWWGSDYTITPCLIDEPMGDGRKFFVVQPLNTRPQYYIVRLDSRVQIREEIDAILEHIEDQVGPAVIDGDESTREPWPALDDAGLGVCWRRLF